MKWPFFSNKTPAPDSGLIDRYKAVRKTGLEINMTLVKQLPKAAVPECGKKLGIFKAGTLILNNDDEIAILYDHCLHHFRRAGKNTIERYAEQAPPVPGSVEEAYFRALLSARYSVFKVEEILPGRGVALRDVVTGEAFDLIDLGLGDSARPGGMLAGRVLPMPDLNMSSGTLIPLDLGVFEDKIMPVLRKFFPGGFPDSAARLSPGQSAAFEAQIIRVALREGGSDNVFYSDVEP
jgi:hypothetical protein